MMKSKSLELVCITLQMHCFINSLLIFYNWIPCIAIKRMRQTFCYVNSLLAQGNFTQQQSSGKPLHLGQNLEKKSKELNGYQKD